jgi:hypothetical protein
VRLDGCRDSFWVRPQAHPDVGKVETDMGNCDVTSVIKHVRADARLDSVPNVKAMYNWWGTSTTSQISPKMSANVDWQPHLMSDPLGTLWERGPEVEAADYPVASILGNTPNPFKSRTEVRYTVPSAGLPVEINVFDVSGRLVRKFSEVTENPGERAWEWDGRDEAGNKAPSGLYFYRVRIGTVFDRTRRMLLIR